MPSFCLMTPQRLRLRPRFAPAAALAATALAIVAPAFFFLYGLDAFPLRDNNEGLYAEIAREMLADGNWIVPHLDGVPYIEKPPLLYWLQAMALAAFGVTPAAARLASALPMLALSLGLAAFVRGHAGGRAGCLAGVILASMVPVALGSHLALFDPLLCALLGGAMLCFLHGALAVLDKGAVALALALGSAGMFLAGARHPAPVPGARAAVARAGRATPAGFHVVLRRQRARAALPRRAPAGRLPPRPALVLRTAPVADAGPVDELPRPDAGARGRRRAWRAAALLLGGAAVSTAILFRVAGQGRLLPDRVRTLPGLVAGPLA